MATTGPAAQGPIHPTPFTLQVDAHPCSLIASCSAVLTLSLPQERQPAAVQTWISNAYFFSSWRHWLASVSRISGVMVYLLMDSYQHSRRIDFPGYVSIKYHCGRQAAGSKTADSEQRKGTVRSCLSGSNAHLLFNRLKKLRSAFDIARGTKAHHTGMGARRLQCEMVIESRYPIGLAQGNMEAVGNVSQRFLVQASKG